MHLILIGRTPDGKNVILGYALIPKESIRHYIWGFLRMIEAGFDFEHVVVFIDRGYAQNAAEYILRVLKILLNLKYCCRHISRNFAKLLKSTDDNVELNNVVFELQASFSSENYLKILDRIHIIMKIVPTFTWQLSIPSIGAILLTPHILSQKLICKL